MLVTVFSSNVSRQAENDTYKRSIDDMIPDIKSYIIATTSVDTTRNPDQMPIHSLIYSNLRLSNPPAERPYQLGKIMNQALSSNISKYVSGVKDLPHDLKKALEQCANTEESYEGIIRRLFWILQYYLVYYFHRGNDIRIVCNDSMPLSANYPEYYRFSPDFARKIFNHLLDECQEFSSTLSKMTDSSHLDIQTLARIILDVVIRQHNDQINESILPAQFIFNAPVVSNEEQMDIYQTKINCYGKNSYDRFNILCKWADQNCYAAAELGDIYAHGARLHISISCYKEIFIDRGKASSLYQRSMELSSPKNPYACWSYADLLRMKYNYSSKKDISILENACTILYKADYYPPALNLLADMEITIADRMRGNLSDKPADDALELYRKALLHAITAADAGWYYSNNKIAMFLQAHMKDTALLSELTKNPKIAPHMNYEEQLGIAVANENLWATNKLAEFYIAQERKEEAKTLLLKACELNYNRAYYTMAMNICQNPLMQSEYLHRASELSYPHASYELASMYYDSQDMEKALTYINLAREQMNAWLKKDMDMAVKIDILKDQIEHDFV